jgi:general transcription factor 3C polypeptide 3 (transcription factor C subunit 4)
LQKHTLRELRLHDTAVKTPELLKWNPIGRRYGLSSSIKEEPSKANDGEEDADDDAEIPGATESTAAEKMPIRMPTKNNPVIITLYGQMCLASKSYQSAICKFADYSEELLVTIFSVYLLHAYDYCPEDPVVCLSLAIASLGRAMQRQSDNRHHMIAQVNILYFLLV